MGNNKEIRQRMETYRNILLVLNWIGALALIIVGFVLAYSGYTQGIGIGVIIGSVVIGVIGHFLINVALAIPFILLNNGDILESMKNGSSGSSINDDSSETSSFIPSHRVKLNTDADGLGLREIPNPYNIPFTKISDGTEIQHLSTGEEVSLNDKKGFWYEIVTKDKIKGWCFSESLEKI